MPGCINLQLPLTSYPYPLEYREGATTFITSRLLAGENIYAIANQPLDTNVYGVLYNLLVLPFAHLFGPTLVLHRSVSGVFIIACCLLIFQWAKEYGLSKQTAWSVGLLFYASLLFYTTPLTRPDSLGLFLFLVALYIPWSKDFSRASLALSITAAILSFFVKVYFLLAPIILAAYLFIFVSKRSGLLFGIAWTAIFSLTILLTNFLLPTYLNEVFGISVNFSDLSSSYLYHQIRYFINQSYQPLCLLTIIVALVRGYRFFRAPLPHSMPGHARQYGINLTFHTKPLIGKRMDFLAFCLVMSSLLLWTSLGRHNGAFMTYFYQLASPFFLILTASYCSKHISSLLVTAVIAANVIYFFHRDMAAFSTFNSKSTWPVIQGLIATHHRILNSPAIAPLLVESNRPVFDSGQTEYGFGNDLKIPGIKRFFEQKNALLAERSRAYKSSLLRDIQLKSFDLAIITNNGSGLIDERDLLPYYSKTRSIHIKMSHSLQEWDLDIWVPKKR